jgi:hypothetical protein
MSAGRGAVSIKVVWLNLQLHFISRAGLAYVHLNSRNIHRLSC